MFKAYFHATPMSKHQHTIAPCLAKWLHRLEAEPEMAFPAATNLRMAAAGGARYVALMLREALDVRSRPTWAQ
jgi:hypothetical protein